MGIGLRFRLGRVIDLQVTGARRRDSAVLCLVLVPRAWMRDFLNEDGKNGKAVWKNFGWENCAKKKKRQPFISFHTSIHTYTE